MADYLAAIEAAGPLSIRELAERTGRGEWARGNQYGPAHRLVRARLARWQETERRGRYLLAPTTSQEDDR